MQYFIIETWMDDKLCSARIFRHAIDISFEIRSSNRVSVTVWF